MQINPISLLMACYIAASSATPYKPYKLEIYRFNESDCPSRGPMLGMAQSADHHDTIRHQHVCENFGKDHPFYSYMYVVDSKYMGKSGCKVLVYTEPHCDGEGFDAGLGNFTIENTGYCLNVESKWGARSAEVVCGFE